MGFFKNVGVPSIRDIEKLIRDSVNNIKKDTSSNSAMWVATGPKLAEMFRIIGDNKSPDWCIKIYGDRYFIDINYSYSGSLYNDRFELSDKIQELFEQVCSGNIVNISHTTTSTLDCNREGRSYVRIGLMLIANIYSPYGEQVRSIVIGAKEHIKKSSNMWYDYTPGSAKYERDQQRFQKNYALRRKF